MIGSGLLGRRRLGTAVSGGGAGASPDLPSMMLSLPGLVAYWKLDEESGTTAVNAEGTATRDGTYVNSPALQAATFPNGDLVALFDGVNDAANMYTASLDSVWNGTKGWLSVWFQDAALGLEGRNYVFSIDTGTGLNIISLFTDNTNPSTLEMYYKANNVFKFTSWYNYSARWHNLTMDWDDAGTDAVRWWFDGVLIKTITGIGTWGEPLIDNSTTFGAISKSGTFSWNGGGAHVAIGADEILSTALVEEMYTTVFPGYLDMAFSGDSKTVDNRWTGHLVGLLSTAQNADWRLNPLYMAGGGLTTTTLKSYLQTNLASLGGNPSTICLNIGVNELGWGNEAVAEATFKSNLAWIIDAFVAKWPGVDVYVAYPWRQGFNVNAAIMKTWVDFVIATYGSSVFAGPDENVWLENGDDGATYTSDGTHYSIAGQFQCALEWMTVLGY
jgi:hypothetical protein